MKCELRNDVYLIGGANPANPACELLKVRIADLEDKADNETNAAWLSGLQGSGFDSTIEATVLGSVAGGVQKAFKIEVNDVYTADMGRAIFTAFLDDVHASFSSLISRDISPPRQG